MSDLQQTKELFKKLPQKMRDIIASPELIEIIDNITKNNNLDKKQQEIMAKAVFDFLMGVNNKEGIRTVLNTIVVDNVSNQKIFSDVESKILNNLDNINTEINKNNEAEESEVMEKVDEIQNLTTPSIQEPSNLAEATPDKKETPPQNGVGGDFEQIILNQAKAMREAVPPENLPTSPELPIKAPNYSSGDPYREPAE
jgi:hypothetical protein